MQTYLWPDLILKESPRFYFTRALHRETQREEMLSNYKKSFINLFFANHTSFHFCTSIPVIYKITEHLLVFLLSLFSFILFLFFFWRKSIKYIRASQNFRFQASFGEEAAAKKSLNQNFVRLSPSISYFYFPSLLLFHFNPRNTARPIVLVFFFRWKCVYIGGIRRGLFKKNSNPFRKSQGV
jgi:hypothetical protein